MCKVTNLNVLLDERNRRNCDEWNGAVCIYEYIIKKLEKTKGVNLFYLRRQEENDLLKEDEQAILYEDSSFERIDVYISTELEVPPHIKSSIEITKYVILDNIILNTHGNTAAGWYEESIKVYLSEYDFFITSSEEIKRLLFDGTLGLGENRIIVLPLADIIQQSESKKKKDEKKCYVAFYKRKYIKEIEMAIKGFIKYLDEKNSPKEKFILINMEKESEDELFALQDLFSNYSENFSIKNLENNDSSLAEALLGADVFVDTFWLDDHNWLLQRELSCNCRVISNSIAISDDRIIHVKNSIYEYKNAFLKLSKEEYENKGGSPRGCDEEEFFQTIWRIENLKKEQPLVTVITITYNLIAAGRKDTIQQCLKSVHDQTYGNIEHIIIDGASDDGTIELLKTFENRGWIEIFSEKDNGLYDAMNKGIRKARGKYIAFLNSDDFYHDNRGIEKTVCEMQKVQADYAFSDTNILNEDGTIYYWIADIGNILYARNYCHQSMFVKLDVMRELHGFDLSYRVSADSDLMIRILNQGYSHIKVDYPFVTYRGGGLSAITAEESRRDHSYSFYLHLGKKYGLTGKDCYELWQYRFLDELPSAIQARLIAKIPPFFNAEMILNEYVKRQLGGKTNRRFRQFVLEKVPLDKFHITMQRRFKNGHNEIIYYFCKIIPIWISREKLN